MQKVLTTFCLSLCCLTGGSYSVSAGGFDHSHQLFSKALKRFVRDGLVNYSALKSDPKDLDLYLNQLASITETEFKKWSKDQQIAFLTNLYNSQTLRLILTHYPVKSIKDIGGLFKGPWKQPVVRLFGKTITLDDLEHGILRKDYQEPRLHFALVCAALGCTPLREEAYDPAKLHQQLEDQGKKFIAAKHKNSVDLSQKTVNLSPIFKWFEEDFTKKSGTVLNFVQPYFAPEISRELVKDEFKMNYTYYDWSLNDQKK